MTKRYRMTYKDTALLKQALEHYLDFWLSYDELEDLPQASHTRKVIIELDSIYSAYKAQRDRYKADPTARHTDWLEEQKRKKQDWLDFQSQRQ